MPLYLYIQPLTLFLKQLAIKYYCPSENSRAIIHQGSDPLGTLLAWACTLLRPARPKPQMKPGAPTGAPVFTSLLAAQPITALDAFRRGRGCEGGSGVERGVGRHRTGCLALLATRSQPFTRSINYFMFFLGCIL